MFQHTYEIQPGVETEFGVVERTSYTAALIDGAWVPFARLVEQRRAVSVVLPQEVVDLVSPEMTAAMRAESDANVRAMMAS